MTSEKSSRHALIALGANMPFGELRGAAMLAGALARMQETGLKLLRCSSAWETDPWPPSDQPVFVNAVAEVEVGAHTPDSLFRELRGIESEFGRVRRERWGPRTLDLDVLDLGGLVGEFGDISLPHKRLHERAFVLAPLAEIAPDWRHPVLGASAVELWERLAGDQKVRRRGKLVAL